MSAAEFAAATGVGRERLRTWERRHGFPEPVRRSGGARRYDVADVRRVLAVRRALEQGLSLSEAIARVAGPAGGDRDGDGAAGLPDVALALDHAPFPALIVSGPRPLEVAWANGALRASPDAPVPGDDLLSSVPAFAGGAGHAALEELFAADGRTAWIEHPSWTARFPVAADSVAWRLPQDPSGPPLVALLGVPRPATAGDGAGDGAERRVERLRGSLDRVAAWTEATAGATGALREASGPRSIAEALRRLVWRLGALDASLAPYATGALLAGRSANGLLEPAMVAVGAFEEVAGALRDGAVDWLDTPALGAFGVPPGHAGVVVPIAAAGERLGVLLVVFQRELPLGDAERDLLLGLGTTLGFALLRERAMDRVREPAAR